MTETSFHGKKWAVRLAVALLLGFGLIIALAALDKSQRAELERSEEPTGVGDAAFFQPPTETQEPLATFKNQPLYLVGTERFESRDSKMVKAGMDASRTFFVYVSSDPKEKDFRFLKVANGEYLRVSPKP